MFKIGQKVVCIDDTTRTGHNVLFLKKGKIYTVSGLSTCMCGDVFLHVVESKEYAYNFCVCGNNTYSILGWYINRFRPLDETFAEETCAWLNEHFESLKVTV